MKKVLVLVGIVLSFFLVSCADEPFSASEKNIGSTGNIQVVVPADISGSMSKAIYINGSQVTQAVISLTTPSGSVQSQTWRSSSAVNVFYFTASTTGTYTIGVVETDTSNKVYTSSSTATFQGGYNYYVTIILGGNVIVTVGTNGGTTSSVSSVSSASSVSSVSSASSVSSVSSASSVSSVSSASSVSSTSSASTIAKVYSERAEGSQISMDPAWEVWPSTGDSVVFTPIIDSFEGSEAIECSKGNLTWLGFVIKSLASGTAYANLTGYTTLNVALKASADLPFAVQIGCGQAGSAYQKWYDVSLIKDGAWHTYQISITNISAAILGNMQWIFAMRTKSASGDWTTAPSSTISFDDVYYSK